MKSLMLWQRFCLADLCILSKCPVSLIAWNEDKLFFSTLHIFYHHYDPLETLTKYFFDSKSLRKRIPPPHSGAFFFYFYHLAAITKVRDQNKKQGERKGNLIQKKEQKKKEQQRGRNHPSCQKRQRKELNQARPFKNSTCSQTQNLTTCMLVVKDSWRIFRWLFMILSSQSLFHITPTSVPRNKFSLIRR